MQRPAPSSPILLLGLAVAASIATLLAFGSGMTFFQDSWAFLLERPGTSLDDFLRPHNEHISVIPVAIQKLAIAWFGMESDLPERLLLTAMLAGAAVLVFIYARRRLGEWPALIAAVILLFLGPAWEVLLWPFEISLVGSVITGVGMLLALDRDDRRGDLIACALLVVSVGFSSLGVAFALGAAADVFARRRDRGLARLYVPGVALLLYAAWYLAYGHDASGSLSGRNLLHAPLFVAEGFAASLASVLGLRALSGGIGSQHRPILGLLVLAALGGYVAYRWLRSPDAVRGRLARASEAGLWPAATSALAFWGLAAINNTAGRAPFASRYQYIGAFFAFLISANLLVGVRIGRRALAALGAAAAVAVALNLMPLVEGRDQLRDQSTLARADLGAIEIARRTISQGFALGPEVAGTGSLINVHAVSYLREADEHGSPAYDPSQLADAPELGRRQADLVLSLALPITTVSASRPAPGGCTEVRGEEPRSREVPLAPGPTRIEVGPGPPARLALRRFAVEGYPVRLGPIPPGATTLDIPADASGRPWRLLVEADQAVAVCR